MGWPTKGSGRNYNSHTGFGCFVGAHTQKVLMSKIYCRRCRVCELAKRKFTPSKQHLCVQNYPSDGSSKGMEPAAILDMATTCVILRQFVMFWIIADDDSVMRAHLCHPTNAPKDKGKLPLWIMQPTF